MGFEPPINPDEDTNRSQPIDLNNEPPISDEDTNPSASQLMRAVNLDDEPPISDEDTNPSASQLMQAVNLDDEPPINPDDTNPSIAVRESQLMGAAPLPVWRRAFGVVSLLGAVALTVGAGILLLMPPTEPEPAPVPPTEAESVAAEPTVTATIPPTETAPAEIATETTPIEVDSIAALPTLNPEQAAAILSQPLASGDNDGLQVVRNPYDPFTLIPDRPRSEVIQYVVEEGDTIGSIAEKFGLTQESVAWANDRNIINILPVGRSINIPPVDGVLIPRHTGNTTIQEYAIRYRVDDPYNIIDSEYNRQLRGLSPESVPPSGASVMIPNGQAEQINWNPTVVRDGGDSGSGSAGGGFITFAPGDPGSCGRVANPGGSGGWTRPIGNYTWMRGFTSFHTGIDLAAPIGTPVQAAQGGTVIFAGWNNWGYGYTVVLAHGPFTTIYAHLSSINVGCGQSVSGGQTIAGTGNSGNSSGPHLHFEIRFNDQPQDPTGTIGF